jgi:hypothetical protein
LTFPGVFGVKSCPANADINMTMKLCIHPSLSYVAETAAQHRPWLETPFVALGRGNGRTLDRRCAG